MPAPSLPLLFLFLFLFLACGGRRDPLDPRAADLIPALAAVPDPWAAGFRARELALRGFIARERGEDAESERLLRAAAHLDPDDAALLTEHARALALLGHVAEARRRLRRALRSDPTAEHAWLLLAEMELAAGETEAALEAARRAVRVEPLAADAALWLARRLLELGESRAAAELLAGILAQRPHRAGAHLALADVHIALGDLDGARRHLQRFAELAPAPGPAIADRLPVWLDSGDQTETAKMLEIAAAAGGIDPDLRLTLARLLIADGRLARARRHLLALPPVEDGDAASLAERGALFLQAGAPWEARRVMLEQPAAVLDAPDGARLLAEIEAALGRRPAQD